MSLITRRKPLLGRLAAALGIALGLAAGSPLAPALAQQQDEARRCPPGEFEGPESCSGRPLISSGARLALQTGPIALPEGHRSQGYSVNVVASVGSTPAESALEGRLPQGLHLEASGNIAGVPQETGVFQFTVTLSDPTTVPTRTSQSYLLRIVGPTTSRPRPDPRPEPKPQRQPQPRPEPYVKKTGEVTIVVYELTSADLSGLIAGPVSSQAVGAQPTGAGGAVAAGAPAANVAPGALGGAGAPATSASTSGAAAAPTPAPANTPTPSRSSRPPTAAQIANVPGAAARALGAPASVAKVAAVPANLARRANSLTAAFRPLRRRGGTSAPEPAPAPAPEPAPAPALPVVVARAPSQAVAELLQIIFSTRDLPVVSVLPAGFAARAGPLISTPFPTRNLFKAALDHAAANAGVRLSPALSEAVTAKARKAVPYSHATPLHWVSQDGCRCNSPPHGADDKIVYGFYPFWRSGPSGPEVMFSRFNRIGLLGAQLQPDGGWVYPSSPQNAADDWWDGLSPFAMTAQAHNVELDLVLQASDWSFLNNPQLNEQALRTLYEQSARKAMQLLDTPLRGRGLRALLAPVWGQPRYVFGGVTVMFEAPSANSTEYAKFTQFNDGFLRELVREMERRKRRAFALNIVAPDDISDPVAVRDGSPIWTEFLGLKHLAEPAKAHGDLPPAVAQLYVGTSSISMRLLAPMREPTSDAKKVMRVGLDIIPEIKGLDRVELQRSILPILYLPETPFAAGKPLPRTMTAEESKQLSDDLAYAKQTFGGVAFWSLPVRGVEADDEVYHRLQQGYFEQHTSLLGTTLSICSLALRLLLQVLVGLLVAGGVYYAIWGSASGRRVTYLIVLGVVGALATINFLVLLRLDPALEALRVGNLPFITLLVVLGALAGWSLLRPRVPRP